MAPTPGRQRASPRAATAPVCMKLHSALWARSPAAGGGAAASHCCHSSSPNPVPTRPLPEQPGGGVPTANKRPHHAGHLHPHRSTSWTTSPEVKRWGRAGLQGAETHLRRRRAQRARRTATGRIRQWRGGNNNGRRRLLRRGPPQQPPPPPQPSQIFAEAHWSPRPPSTPPREWRKARRRPRARGRWMRNLGL